MREELLFEAESFGVASDFEWEGEVSRRSAAYIRWVQQSLNQILGLRLAVDGDARQLTRSAIRSFQQKHGLTVDGDVGAQTEAALVAAGAPPPPGAQPASPAPAPVSAPGLRADARAEQSLQRLLKNSNTAVSGSAQAMLAAVKGEGALIGIYPDTHEVPAELAAKLKVAPRRLIPDGAAAVVFVNAARPTAPGLAVFRAEIRDDPRRLDIALLKAWSTFQQARNAPAAFTRAAQEAVARRRMVAEAEAEIFSLWEDVWPLLAPVLLESPIKRALTVDEIALAKVAFLDSLNYKTVFISPTTGFNDRPFVLYVPSFTVVVNIPVIVRGVTVLNIGPDIYKNPVKAAGDSRAATFIHELVHAWQSQHHPVPWQYETNSIISQALADLYSLNTGRDADSYCYTKDLDFGSYAAEQIASSVENWFLDPNSMKQKQIVLDIKAVPAGAASFKNIMSLAAPRFAIRGEKNVDCSP